MVAAAPSRERATVANAMPQTLSLARLMGGCLTGSVNPLVEPLADVQVVTDTGDGPVESC